MFREIPQKVTWKEFFFFCRAQGVEFGRTRNPLSRYPRNILCELRFLKILSSLFSKVCTIHHYLSVCCV